MKKFFLFLIIFLFGININSQNDQTINITTTGTGISKNDAINDALRNALEQTYGGFISSKSNITDDELFKDEVVAITSGEIHDYELVSETKIESGYAVTIVAKISQTGLNNFVSQSGGDAIIFNANVFSTKIRLQRLNENAEIIIQGKMQQDGVFSTNTLSIKCPSKYVDNLEDGEDYS